MKRVLILLCGCLVLGAIAPAGASAFKYGVTAGEVTSSSAILWTRAARSGSVTLQVARNNRFTRGLKLYPLRARRSRDLTVQRRVRRLKSNRRYWFRFIQGRRRSKRGTFRTAPSRNANIPIDFAWTGDTDALPLKGSRGRPYWNNFDVFRRMRAERNDFNIHLGDTIYSDSEVPNRQKPVALTVRQKWTKYKINLAQRKLQDLRKSAGFYSHWDDHEFVNDFARSENSFSSAPNVNGQSLYRTGVRAFRDYAPVTYTSRDGIYRTRRWGKNLELFFLDQRSFRSAKADAGGRCDNPPGSGNSDLAPTAPQGLRNVFGVVVPQLKNPTPPACTAAIKDPNRTYLGRRQLNRFLAAVRNSDARFKVIVNELPIQQYYVLPYDRWEGYEAERQTVLNALSGKVKNVVFLTTDVHATLVNDARFQTLESGGPRNSGIMDITVGPAATANFELEIDEAVGKGNGRFVDDLFLEQAPPNGPGMQCSELKTFSYGHVRATRNRLTITPRNIQGRTLTQDPSGASKSTACGPFVLNYTP